MTCNCGKTDKSCPKKFPSAVVEINNPEQIVLLRKVVIPASLGDDTEVPPVIGKYRNVVLLYEANDHIYLYSSDGIPTEVRVPRDILKRIEDLELADQIIEQEIEDLRNNPDVVDIVATYADLVAYDTSKLGDKDVIRVLTDETHDDESTYYRWNKPSQEWVFIGAVEGYYTKEQTDDLLAGKQNVLTAGDNISITNDTISAVDTTYTAGSGLNLSGTEFSVDTTTIQPILTFDSTPTANSTNPVTSDGIKTYVDNAPAFKPFPASVTTDGTTQQLMSSILALSPEVGTAYLGTVELSDMPAGLLQEEVEVYVYSDYVVYCIMRSTDVSPYAWWCASYNYQGWQPVNTDTTYTAGTNITIDANNEISATDTTYTAGNGLTLSGTEFSADNSVVAFQTDLPTVNDATLTIQKNSTDVGTFTANASSNSTINITVPTTAADVSALPDSTKYAASISLTIDSSTYVVTAQLKDQNGNNIGSAQTIDLPLESVVVSGAYDSQTKEVVLTLQGGSTIRFSVADLVSGLQETLIAGTNIQIAADGKTISATDTTYSAFTGATSQDAGAAGLVPAPAAGDEGKFLSGNGLWTTVSQYTLPIASANDLGGIKVGTNLSIDSSTGVLSATDTTYSNFTGTDGTAAGAAGLVPAPATTDAGKFLKADGTWTVVNADAIKMLTTADYNANSSNWNDTDPANFNCIATWKLSTGFYKTTGGPMVWYSKSHNLGNQGVTWFRDSNSGDQIILRSNLLTKNVTNSSGTEVTGPALILTDAMIVNTLTSVSPNTPLSANQGRVLNEKIEGRIITNAGAPTTSTVGTVGQLLEDTTNGKLYICTDATNPYVWEEVGSGGGGDVISSADWAALWADTIQNMNGVGV